MQKQWDQGTFLHEALELEHQTSSMVLPPSLLTALNTPRPSLFIFSQPPLSAWKKNNPPPPPPKKMLNKGLITVFL